MTDFKTMENPIPPITDPQGRYWTQPDPSAWRFEDKKVFMPQKDFDALKEYSTTIPTGKYTGKMWKANLQTGWRLIYTTDTHYVPIEIVIEETALQ